MKNIHVLATGKPSNLCINGKNFQNIYITSDEGIKEGNWVVDNNGLIAKVITELTWHFINSKKIILTTDQDLIKDGVQAIDDDFLEWFFDNSNCEMVEINSEKIHIGWEPDYSFEDKGIEGSKKSYQTFYKIIIPQQEQNKKISSVEWLKKELEDYGSNSHLSLDWNTFDELCEQAKAMHKEEAALSWIEACEAIIFSIENNETNTFSSQKQFEEYYKKTYGQD